MARMTPTTLRPSKEVLAENLARILDERGRGSRKSLAEQLGWKHSRISNILRGEINVDLGTVDLLAEALGIDPHELIH